MKQFDARSYSIADFLEWHANGLLELSPDFQRRSVWTRAAKSFLIDTVVRGKPMPKVLLTQDLIGKKNVRKVVEGQQRIRSILEFVSDSFTMLKAHNFAHAGTHFSELHDDMRSAILQYEIGVDLLYNVSLSDMLDIFARINTYSVTLNRQEKLNAKYLGVFKTSAYELGFSYVEYFLSGRVFTERNISRMEEAALASDMLVALVGGVQTSKNVEKYYQQYEQFEQVPDDMLAAIDRFKDAMQYIGAIYPALDLRNVNWSRQPWFYTLFTCVAHAREAIAGLDGVPRPSLCEDKDIRRWRSDLDEISARYDHYQAESSEDVPAIFRRFINYAERRTTDTEARIGRARFVLEAITV
jgi:hypothetical protein